MKSLLRRSIKPFAYRKYRNYIWQSMPFGVPMFSTFCEINLTIWMYDLHTGIAVDTGVTGKHATLYETVIAFTTPEFSIANNA